MLLEALAGTIPARGFDWDAVRYPARRVGEFATLCYGKSLVETKRRPGNVPMYGTNGQCGWNDKALTQGPGVILGRKGQGHLGVKWCEVPFWVIDTAYFAEVNRNEVDLRWFYYITKYVGLDHLKTGEKPGLSRDIFGRQLFPFPKRDHQESIARILGTLDDKIDLNRRMNHTLEALARAIFQSWFVDFDPVVARAAGRQPVGMSSETARLFPDRFEDSPLGPIPKGWRVGKVSDLAVISRNALAPSSYPIEVFEHYSIPAFDDGQRPKRELGSAIKSNKFLVPVDAVLVSKLNPEIPRVWLPSVATGLRSICSTEFLVTLARPPATRPFLYAMCCSDAFRGEFSTLVTGTSNSHQRVKPDDFSCMSAVIPTAPCITAFTMMANSPLERVQAHNRQRLALEPLRDALLRRLLSGELRVKNAEQIVETA